MGSTRTRLCSQPQRWSSGSARRPRDHSQPLGSGMGPTERGPEPAGEVCGGIYSPCFPGSRVPHGRLSSGRHGSGSNFWRGRQVRKSALKVSIFVLDQKKQVVQPSFCTVGGKGPKWSYQPCHPCTVQYGQYSYAETEREYTHTVSHGPQHTEIRVGTCRPRQGRVQRVGVAWHINYSGVQRHRRGHGHTSPGDPRPTPVISLSKRPRRQPTACRVAPSAPS